MSRPFGILYDSTFPTLYDPYDVRYGHQHVPRAPKPFTPLNQCSAYTTPNVPQVMLAAVAFALGFMMVRRRNK